MNERADTRSGISAWKEHEMVSSPFFSAVKIHVRHATLDEIGGGCSRETRT